MNASLEFVSLNLETETSLKRFIFNSVVDAYIEERIKTLNLSTEEERLLQYFFKVQTASDKLLKAVFEGLQQESTRLLQNHNTSSWKKNELNTLRKLLATIIDNLKDYGKLTADWERKFEEIVAKINKQNLSGAYDYQKMVKHFQETATSKIDANIILIEEDWAREWAEMHEANLLEPEVFSPFMVLNQEEILFYHFIALFAQILRLCDLFAQPFRRKYNFSISNILKNEEIKKVPEKVKLNDAKLNLELFEILKHHVSPKSVGHLMDFWEGKEVSEPIEFLGKKGELFSIFRMLYKNNKITRNATLIGKLVAKSFILPFGEEGVEVNPKRVREALSRNNRRLTLLPEIRDLAERLSLNL